MSKSEGIKKEIIADIYSGVLDPTRPFPTRRQLMVQYDVARATIDRVVSDLINEGFLKAKQGSGTFIVPVENKEGHFYMVLNTETHCPEASSFHNRLQDIITDQSLSCTLIGNMELKDNFTRLISCEGNRVVWSRPSLSCYYFIDQLRQHGVRQMVINRILPGYCWIATDTLSAIGDALDTSLLSGSSTSVQKGIINIKQRWDLMFDESLQWLRENPPGLTQKLVMPDIVTVE